MEPPHQRIAPQILVTGLFRDHHELFHWESQFSVSDTVIPSLSTLLAEINCDSHSDIDRLRNTFQWVQHNIRYIAFEAGDASFQPDCPSEVLRKRYGDCKGMAMLLRTLLRAQGFDARLTDIGTTEIPYRISQYPTLAAANHKICTVFHQGHTYFLDATHPHLPLGYFPQSIQGKEAMIEKTGYKFDSENFEVTPQPTATMVIIDQHTGYVVAIANGRSEKKGNLTGNLATQGVRQPGSTFKVIASFLPYLDTGGNLAFTQKDEPYEFADGSGIVNNWYGGYHGSGSIRDGIRDSMNVIAVKTITLVSSEVAFHYCEKLGFTTLIRENENGATDITQSLALGGLTYGVTNLEITAAYATIANGGIYRKPVFYSKVYDHDGNLIIDHSNDDETRARRVIKPTTAWMLIDCMRDVISWEGTSDAAIPRNDFDRAGKTGTTSSTYDLWFCGMSPYYTASVWYGYETQTRLGDRTDHKRIWRDVMDKICEHQHWDPDRLIMEQPEGLTQVTVCKLSGDLPSGGCPTNTDWGAVDSLPSNYCEGHETIRVCMETHKIATDMCPDAKEYAVTTDRKTGKKTIHDADFEYDESIFSSSCDKHKSKEELGLDEEGRPVIKTSATEGGEISGTTSVPMNSSVTVFIKPHDGYIIKDVTVNGQSVGPVTQWAINNVDRGQTINAVFEKINQDPQPQPQPQPQPEPDPQPNDQQQTPPDNPGDGGDDSGDSGDDSGDSGDSGESGE